MSDHKTNPQPSPSATAHQKRNEVLRSEGRPPETPVSGYRFGDARCLTPGCPGVLKYEISKTAPWRLNNDHVVCDRCAATYQVSVETIDGSEPQVSVRNADDRQS